MSKGIVCSRLKTNSIIPSSISPKKLMILLTLHQLEENGLTEISTSDIYEAARERGIEIVYNNLNQILSSLRELGYIERDPNVVIWNSVQEKYEHAVNEYIEFGKFIEKESK